MAKKNPYKAVRNKKWYYLLNVDISGSQCINKHKQIFTKITQYTVYRGSLLTCKICENVLTVTSYCFETRSLPKPPKATITHNLLRPSKTTQRQPKPPTICQNHLQLSKTCQNHPKNKKTPKTCQTHQKIPEISKSSFSQLIF